MTRPPPRLVAEWNRKLRASGFEDIETPDGRLRGSDEQHQADAEASWRDRDPVAAYYRSALQFIHTRKYQGMTRTRRRIWSVHALGFSNTEAAREVGVSVKAVRVAVTLGRRLAGLPAVTHTLGQRNGGG